MCSSDLAKGQWLGGNDTEPEAGSGFIVLSMGKHGAGELNYSSDIDLIVFYDLDRAHLREGLEPERWSLGAWFGQRLGGGLNRMASILRLPLGPLRKLRPQQWEGARSCNLAVWRADIDRVDGFDQAFSGWGKEDSDLQIGRAHV